ncbi:Mis6-domain-containing protein [Lipomyces oligophaga]|uniref:Mis6-domain-containing protein n=1 Tax=Lipomyces oligophaga TaxID=45792 RepID=UPI0034CD3227
MEESIRITRSINRLTSSTSKSYSEDQLSLLSILTPRSGVSSTDRLTVFSILQKPPSGCTYSHQQRLVRLLYPRDKIQHEELVYLVGILGSGKGKIHDFRVQASLLRWLVVVYPLLESRSHVVELYGVLFFLLGYESLRPWISHILFQTTEKKHVKPWRIQYLTKLQRNEKASQGITGLLLLFKEYHPDLVVDYYYAGISASLFRHPDPEFLDVVANISTQQYLATRSPDSIIPSKRRKSNRFPEIRFRDHSTHDLADLSNLVASISRIALPAQLGCLFRDETLTKRLFVLRNTPQDWSRLNTWLSYTLIETLPDADLFLQLLNSVRDFVRYTRTVPIALEEFLVDRLIPELDPMSFIPLSEAFFDVILFLTSKIDTWTEFETQFVRPLTRVFEYMYKFQPPNYALFVSQFLRFLLLVLARTIDDIQSSGQSSKSVLMVNRLLPRYISLIAKTQKIDEPSALLVQLQLFTKLKGTVN